MNPATLKKKPFFEDFPGSEASVPGQYLFIRQVTVRHSTVPDVQFLQHDTGSLKEARLLLSNMPVSELPELIILDIPLSLNELTQFRNWVSRNLIPPIPVIYKESWLNRSDIIRLFHLNLIDDVIQDVTSAVILQGKVRFFKNLAVQSIVGPRALHVNREKRSTVRSRLTKRMLDIVLSLTLLIVISPLLALIAVLIKLTSRGPVIYKSKRAGEGYKVFDFYKFRTMVKGASEMLDSLGDQNMYRSAKGAPSFFKVLDDPRITKIGQFLRNTSMDELPQLFNVLKGDMSLVGNRPLPLYEAATLTTHDWAERFAAPAGITGLWQISKRGHPKMSAEERISLDITYARERSTLNDLKILLRTPAAIMQRHSQ